MTSLIENMKSYFEKSKRLAVVAVIEEKALLQIILEKIQVLERKITSLLEIFLVMKNLDFVVDNTTKMTDPKIKD